LIRLWRPAGPSPRIIDKELWAKVLWADMNLQVADLPVWGNGNDLPPYPIEMVRAIAVVWCFTGLRSDEIRRLRVGCIRRQYEDVMILETALFSFERQSAQMLESYSICANLKKAHSLIESLLREISPSHIPLVMLHYKR